jgi:hypothetical protein
MPIGPVLILPLLVNRMAVVGYSMSCNRLLPHTLLVDHEQNGEHIAGPCTGTYIKACPVSTTQYLYGQHVYTFAVYLTTRPIFSI